MTLPIPQNPMPVRGLTHCAAPQVNSLSYGMAEVNVDKYLGQGYLARSDFEFKKLALRYLIFPSAHARDKLPLYALYSSSPPSSAAFPSSSPRAILARVSLDRSP